MLGALGQGMYWFLIYSVPISALRAAISTALRVIVSAPRRGSRWDLRGLLAASGLDPARDNIRIGPVPRTRDPGTNFGLAAAEALEEDNRRVLGQRHGRENRRHPASRHGRAR